MTDKLKNLNIFKQEEKRSEIVRRQNLLNCEIAKVFINDDMV